MGRMIGVLAGVATFALCSVVFANTVETESAVTEVTLYRNCALVTRQAKVTLQAGQQEVVLTNTPGQIDESTISVLAAGDARAKILNAKIKKIFLEKSASDAVRILQEKIENLQDQLVVLEDQRIVLEKQRDFLASIKLHADNQLPKDLVTKMPGTAELTATLDFIRLKWQETFTQKQGIEKQKRGLKDTIEKLERELDELQQSQGKEKRVISVELDIEKPGTLEVSASYLMYQAGWVPEYDARVNTEKQEVELVCYGIVKQASGEDWKNVAFTLSTAQPTVSGKMPELQSWVVRPRPPITYAQGDALKKRAMDFAPDGALMEKMEMGGYAYEHSRTMAAPVEELYAATEENLTSVTYKIERSADLKADGTTSRLPIFSKTLSAQFRYATTPKLSGFAYLVGKVTSDQEQLLPAAVRVFVSGAYISSSRIDAVGKGESFELFLGIDEGIKVKREKLKEDTKEIWIAGIQRNNKVVVMTYKITVENYKNKDITLDLFDHVPVSQSDQIAVKVIEVKPEATEKDYKDRKGVVRWELTLASKDKKEVQYTYQLEYPRDIVVNF